MELFTLKVMNLPSTTTEDDMRDTGKGRGYALVSFRDKHDARKAYKYIHDRVYKDRQLSVVYEEKENKVKGGSSRVSSSSRSTLNRSGERLKKWRLVKERNRFRVPKPMEIFVKCGDCFKAKNKPQAEEPVKKKLSKLGSVPWLQDQDCRYDRRIKLLGQNNGKVTVSATRLLALSPSLREMFPHQPCCSLPSLSLPWASLQTLQLTRDLLHTGEATTASQQDLINVDQLLKALGVDISLTLSPNATWPGICPPSSWQTEEFAKAQTSVTLANWPGICPQSPWQTEEEVHMEEVMPREEVVHREEMVHREEVSIEELGFPNDVGLVGGKKPMGVQDKQGKNGGRKTQIEDPAQQDQATEEEDMEREDSPSGRRPKEMEQGLMYPSVKPDEEVPCGFVCSICPPNKGPIKYSSDQALAVHVKKHFNNRDKDLPCSVAGCNHRSNYKDLVNHFRMKHTKQFLFVCGKCGHKLHNADGKIAHVKKHEDPGKKQCGGCKMFFSGRKLCKCPADGEAGGGEEDHALTKRDKVSWWKGGRSCLGPGRQGKSD